MVAEKFKNEYLKTVVYGAQIAEIMAIDCPNCQRKMDNQFTKVLTFDNRRRNDGHNLRRWTRQTQSGISFGSKDLAGIKNVCLVTLATDGGNAMGAANAVVDGKTCEENS